MTESHNASLFNPKVDFAIQISGGVHPQSLDDLNALHKDPTYELVSGAREAYFIKKMAGLLSRKIAQSEDVRNMARLIEDSARELERNWRMASCISNVRVSTGYPYLPTIPHAAPVPGTPEGTPVNDKGISPAANNPGIGISSNASADTANLKKAYIGGLFPITTASSLMLSRRCLRTSQLNNFICFFRGSFRYGKLSRYISRWIMCVLKTEKRNKLKKELLFTRAWSL